MIRYFCDLCDAEIETGDNANDAYNTEMQIREPRLKSGELSLFIERDAMLCNRCLGSILRHAAKSLNIELKEEDD